QGALPTMAHIGVMNLVTPEVLELFRTGMRNLGWVEGHNLVIVARDPDSPSGDPETYAEAARDLVRQGVDVIRVSSTPATLAVTQVTPEIPIVFNMDNPVGRGVVASLAHPGGNATGVYDLTGAVMTTKRLQLLIELVPGLSRVAFLTNPDNPTSDDGMR